MRSGGEASALVRAGGARLRQGYGGSAVARENDASGGWRAPAPVEKSESGRSGRSGKSGGEELFTRQASQTYQAHPTYLAYWDRDEWDVSLSDGAVYRIFQDRDTQGWFIDAIAD